MTTAPATTPKPRRRWLQYSLRTMMVLVLVFGVGFGWLAFQVQRTQVEQKAATAIEELGGWVEFRPASGDDLSGYVTGVQLGDTQVTDTGLAHLRGLTQLRWLYLHNTQVSDAGLAHLGGLTQLVNLDLDNAQVSDLGLVHLRGLTNIRILSLNNTQVSDAGLLHLRGLTQLQALGLARTQVSDAGLEYLRGLTQLRHLFLNNTRVTDASVAELQKALPNCDIIR
jgi:hypothetical protein